MPLQADGNGGWHHLDLGLDIQDGVSVLSPWSSLDFFHSGSGLYETGDPEMAQHLFYHVLLVKTDTGQGQSRLFCSCWPDSRGVEE